MKEAAHAIHAADLRGPRGARPALRCRAPGDLPGVPAVHRVDREERELPGRRPARADLGRDHGAAAEGEADGDRRAVRRDEGVPRRLLPGRCKGPRRGARHRGAHPVGALRGRGGPAHHEDRALGACPEAAVHGSGGTVSASIRRRWTRVWERPTRAAPHRRSDGAPLPCCAVTDRGFPARAARGLGRRSARRPQPAQVSRRRRRGPIPSRTFVTPRNMKRRKPIACLLSACRRQTCGTRAGPNSAAGRRGRRRSAYEAPRAAADGGTRLGGAESKRRRRPRLPAPPSRVTLLELVAPLADQVARTFAPGARGVDRPLGQHEAVARAEAELLSLGAERDLAVDHPEALVVIVRVRRVVGVGRIDPEERLEAVGRETRGERTLRRRVRTLPWNSFETHEQISSMYDYYWARLLGRGVDRVDAGAADVPQGPAPRPARERPSAADRSGTTEERSGKKP